MRKLIVGLMVVGLLAFAGQVDAQNSGTGDPLGLISSAAVQPFWSGGAFFTIVEITSPVNDHSGFVGNPFLHGVFFNAACNRDFSIPLPVTPNDVLLFTPDDLGVNYNGLLVIADTTNNLSLIPIPDWNPIHVRGHWVSVADDFIRSVDPVAVAAAETFPTQQTWNPLRSAASWSNPLEDAVFNTTIFLVCPGDDVTGPNGLAVSSGFPPAPPRPNPVFGVIYDGDEVPLRNITIACDCLSTFPVLNINSVYGDPTYPLFYTELVTIPFSRNGEIVKPANPPAFTGYRAIHVNGGFPGGQGDQFGRLNNGNALSYQIGVAVPNVR